MQDAIRYVPKNSNAELVKNLVDTIQAINTNVSKDAFVEFSPHVRDYNSSYKAKMITEKINGVISLSKELCKNEPTSNSEDIESAKPNSDTSILFRPNGSIVYQKKGKVKKQ
jgi:hypothetical protein